MAYTKLGWVNDQAPALNQTNLNHMDQGIYDAHQELAEYEDIFTGDLDDLSDDLSDLKSEINQTMELGALANGVDSASTSAVRSKGFVYAPSGTRLRATKYNNTNFNVTVCQYDANKTFLTGQNLTINSTTSATTGSNTRYVRYFFWAVPALVDAVTDADLVAFASLVTVTLPRGVSENRTDIDTLKTKVASAESDIDTLEAVTTENYSSLINVPSVVSDLDSINTNIAYRFNYALNSTSIPSNTPYGSSWKSERVVYFLSIVKTEGVHSAGDVQLFFGSDGIYERDYASSWKSWQLILSANVTEIYPTLLNGTSIVPDLNGVNKNIVYRFNFALNATSIPANTPYGNSWKSDCVVFFQSIVKTKGTHSAGDQQIFIGSDGVYIRYYGASWNDWHHIADKDPNSGATITVDANGSGDYTSLCEAIVNALLASNTTVYVKQGTYDAIAEMKALYGNDYFDNLTSAGENMIYLQNGIKIICEAGTVMTCHYTGNNAYVKSYFAPINFRRGKATIENLEINASNVRYCIHDDQWDSTIPYTHILKNCHLIIDNSGNTDWTRRLAYGGGLGVHGYIEFDNCYFKSVGLDGSAYSGYGACGFHNSPSADARNRVVLNNCYFADNSTFRFTYYGQATVKSIAFVSGCSLGRTMELTNEDAVLSPNVNVEIIDCNNVIRS